VGLKAWRVKKLKPKVTLGRGIGMQEVGMYSLCGLVGIFGYWAMAARDIQMWVADTWGSILGYLPEVFILTKGL